MIFKTHNISQFPLSLFYNIFVIILSFSFQNFIVNTLFLYYSEVEGIQKKTQNRLLCKY